MYQMVSFPPDEYPEPLLTPSVQHLVQHHQLDQAGKADADQAMLGVEGARIAVAKNLENINLG